MVTTVSRGAPRRVLLAMCATVVVLFGTTAAARAETASPANQLQVWNLNTNQMGTGGGTDYHQFVDYITAAALYYPDIVTIQEAGFSSPSCHEFEYALEARLPGHDYFCYETGKQGGTAVVYRTQRLSYHKRLDDLQLISVNQTTGSCAVPDQLSGWHMIRLQLKDDGNGKLVNVASVHLPVNNYPPSGPGNTQDCTWENMKRVSPAIDALGSASMAIMAGDFNHPDATDDPTTHAWLHWECWYVGTNTDLGLCGTLNFHWKDPLYRACLGASYAATYSCLHVNHWTHDVAAQPRIDFLFAKAYSISRPGTVPFPNAYAAAGSPPGPTKYSTHRGQGALLTYYAGSY